VAAKYTAVTPRGYVTDTASADNAAGLDVDNERVSSANNQRSVTFQLPYENQHVRSVIYTSSIIQPKMVAVATSYGIGSSWHVHMQERGKQKKIPHRQLGPLRGSSSP